MLKPSHDDKQMTTFITHKSKQSISFDELLVDKTVKFYVFVILWLRRRLISCKKSVAFNHLPGRRNVFCLCVKFISETRVCDDDEALS